MLDFSKAVEKLITCKTTGKNDDLNGTLTELEALTVDAESWPSGFFESLVRLLGDEAFLKLKDSWKLLHFINNNWDQLSPGQRKRLRSVLARSFDRYADWMGAFVAAEIFGEHYRDEEALKTLRKLAKVARLPARALVPHGLEVLAETTGKDSIRRLAIHELQRLAQSKIKDVRKEAMLSLRKLGQAPTAR